MPLPAPGASGVGLKPESRIFPAQLSMLMLLAPASAFSYHLIGARSSGAVATAARPVAMSPAQPVRWQTAARLAVPRMVQVDESSSDIYDDFMGLNEAGESVPLELEEKEKLYLECLDSFYNEGGKEVLSNQKYEQLKLDLEFSESKIMSYSKDEIRYLLANKRFKMGQPVLDDKQYDDLRLKLKKAGSAVALHDSPTCSVETGVCKMDLMVDKGKTRLLYLPGVAGGLIVFCEASFWFLHLDPILSIVLGIVPVFFFGKFFTENIFAQSPLVVTAPCPECSSLLTVYFGDLFRVQTDGVLKGNPQVPESKLSLTCSTCKKELIADRDSMVIASLPKF